MLTGVEVVGNASEGDKMSNLEQSVPKASLKYRSLAVFKKDRMVGWLSDEETSGYNYITDNVVKTSGNLIGDDGRPIVIEAIRTTTKRKMKMVGGEPHIYIHVKAECNVQEVHSKDNMEAESVIRQLERKSEERIILRMETAVKQINERYNVDIMGFGQMIYRANPKA